MPFDCANTFGQCTLIAATIITDSISAGPTGPSSPSATSTPLVNSAAPAAAANVPAGPEAQAFEEPARAGQPVAAKPSEQLLRAVRGHQRANHEPNENQACIHCRHSFLTLAGPRALGRRTVVRPST